MNNKSKILIGLVLILVFGAMFLINQNKQSNTAQETQELSPDSNQVESGDENEGTNNEVKTQTTLHL